jgi:hypothetical protein
MRLNPTEINAPGDLVVPRAGNSVAPCALITRCCNARAGGLRKSRAAVGARVATTRGSSRNRVKTDGIPTIMNTCSN